MADDRPQDHPDQPRAEGLGEQPEDTAPPVDSGRVKRAPPTIDLDASEVSDSPPKPAGDPALYAEGSAAAPPDSESEAAEPVTEFTGAAAGPSAGESAKESMEEATGESTKPSAPISNPISPWVIAPVSGAVAAVLVIGVGWMLGWPAIQPVAPAPPPVSAASHDALAARLSSVEAKMSKPAGPVTDAAATERIDALEKAVAALRGDVAASRAQSDKLAASIGDLKPAASGAVDAAPDLSGINARLDQLERAQHADSAAIAQDGAKLADDAPLRRVVVATLLDLSVRQGEPYATTLTAAKSLAPDTATLQPLEGFATSGVPTAAALSRELLTLLPKLAPPPPAESTGSDLVDRLKAGAQRLVRIERTDGVGTDPGAIVARMTAAALHNDSSEARRELNLLSAADRAAAQSWIDKADARDAALAAARQFAADAMAALAKPSQ